MSRPGARRGVAGAVLALGALTSLAGCSTATSGPGAWSGLAAASSLTVPLSTASPTSSGSIAVVAMGTLNDPLNTFWQLFVRAGATERWTLATPPGVADNGGLVVSAAPSATTSATTADGDEFLLAGFEPSQALAFSPLAASSDQGSTWSAALVDGGLASVPDALSASTGRGLLALVRGHGGEVMHSDGDPSTWTATADDATIATSAGGRSCQAGALTAVAFDAEGDPLVGTACSTPGEIGILAMVGGQWRLAVPELSGRLASAPTRVLRLVDVSGSADGLVAVGAGPTSAVISLSGGPDGRWRQSPPLPIGSGDRILATSVEPGGGFVVLTTRPQGVGELHTEAGPGGPWVSLSPPPPGTATVVVGPGGAVDSLVVASTLCTDWRFDASTASWAKGTTVTVPIQFGSSA